MKSSYLTAFIPFGASLALATPTPTIEKRATVCGEQDTITTGNYLVDQDEWGASSGIGWQCTTVSSSSDSIVWHTDWDWSGSTDSVKSYPNVQPSAFGGAVLTTFGSIETTWSWGYTGSSIAADVANDMYLGTTRDGDSAYEIMVWLAALGGVQPLSTSGFPIASANLCGHEFQLSKGINNGLTVYSFVAESDIYSFSGNLLEFYDYLEDHEGVSSSQYLQRIHAGSEMFAGSEATFKTYYYTVL